MLALQFLHIFPLIRPLAFILTFLWFAFLVSLGTLLCYWLGKRVVNAEKWQKILRCAYPLALVGLLGLAVYNAYVPKVVHYQVKLDKPLAPLRIGVASDFHLGTFFGGKQLAQLATIFQQQQVDLILLPSDIMDDNLTAYFAENMHADLAKLTAPLGVYATLGNHDFFGQEKPIAEQIRQAGITVLWDQAVVLPQQFAIVGRNDDLLANRPSAAELIRSLDPTLPIFLMDHRPTDILTHATLPIDIQVSGHTHKGQIFPANFITQAIYPLAHGYQAFGLGHYFVTSGYGFWGVPMRLGSQSEVMIIDVEGKH